MNQARTNSEGFVFCGKDTQQFEARIVNSQNNEEQHSFFWNVEIYVFSILCKGVIFLRDSQNRNSKGRVAIPDPAGEKSIR